MIKIGVFQMTSGLSLQDNKAWILDQLYSHDLSDYQFLFFPENSLSLKITDYDRLEKISLTDPFWDELKAICEANNLEMQISTAIQDVVGKNLGPTLNSSLWITKEGIQSVYNKIHLFKVKLPNKTIDEHMTFDAGERPVIHKSELGLTFGSTICFDLRFPKLYQYYADQNVDVITVPSAFLERTGKDHWHVLLKARAIETQAYIIASAQSGHHICPNTNQVRHTFGHSLVVDPWGNVILDAGQDAGLFHCFVDIDFLKKTRATIPMDRAFKG